MRIRVLAVEIVCLVGLFLLSCAETPVTQPTRGVAKITPASKINPRKIPQLIYKAYEQNRLMHWDASIENAKIVIDFFETENRRMSIGYLDAHIILAMSYRDIGRYEECIRTSIKAYEISSSEEFQQETKSYFAIWGLGDLFSSLGHAEYKNELHELAIRIASVQSKNSNLDVILLRWLADKEERTVTLTKSVLEVIEVQTRQCGHRKADHDCLQWSLWMDDDKIEWIRKMLLVSLAPSADSSNGKEAITGYGSQLLSESFRYHVHEIAGYLYLMLGDTQAARNNLSYAEEYIKKMDQSEIYTKNHRKSSIERMLGELSLIEKDLHRAEQHMRNSIYLALSNTDRRKPNFGNLVRSSGSLNLLAQICWLNNKLLDSVTAWSEAANIAGEQFRSFGQFEDERLLLQRIGALQTISHTIISTLYMEPVPQRRSILARLALASTLLSQARVAEAVHDWLPFPSPKSQEQKTLYQRLMDAKRRLSDLEGMSPGAPATQQYLDRRLDLRNKVHRFESEYRQITGRSSGSIFPPSQEIVQAVTARLAQGDALVNYVQICLRDPRIPLRNQSENCRYLALVLLPGGRVEAIDLGNAREINASTRRLHESLARQWAGYELSAQTVYNYLIRPLLPLLADAQNLYLVPDSELHLLPFDVLLDGTQTLASRYSMSYLTSGRDLLRGHSKENPNTVVVFANPDLNASLDAEGHVLTTNTAPISSAENAVTDFERSRTLPLRRTPIGLARSETQEPGSLPGADKEAKAIAGMLGAVTVYQGAAASERALFELEPAPAILHFATHGRFFGEDAELPLQLIPRGGPPIDVEAHVANPLLQSALLLAGYRRGRVRPDSPYDGLATALEISHGMRLQGTKLVVLSACGTARGVPLEGEGVASLQRAFLVAGAESVVGSLWAVPDRVTARLMATFYQLLRAGESRRKALRLASAILRSNPNYAHPYFWAGFVLVGQDGPIHGLKP